MGKLFFAVIVLCISLGCVQAQIDPAQQMSHIQFDRISLTMGGQKYDLEYAKTFEQRAKGLMFRKELCEDCGMLFKFDSPKFAGIWMKNTFIPLDLAFIDRNGVITDIKPLTPHNLDSVVASKKVLYALEMSQGWFSNHNIKVGDQVTIHR